MTAGEFEGLFRRHHPVIRRIVTSRTRDPALADDITAAAFLRLLSHPPTAEDSNIGGWLNTVATNQLRDHLKSSAHRREQPSGIEQPSADNNTSPSAERVVIDAMDRREQEAFLNDVWRTVAELSPAQRRCLELRFGDAGLSRRETAERMGCSVRAVASAQHRGTTALRAQLGVVA